MFAIILSSFSKVSSPNSDNISDFVQITLMSTIYYKIQAINFSLFWYIKDLKCIVFLFEKVTLPQNRNR